jgi:hypothetical protein
MNSQSDPIQNLPTDEIPPSHNDLAVLNTIFQQQPNTVNKILLELKSSFIFIVIFIILSLPQLDQLIKRFIPFFSTSPYYLVVFKALLFGILYYLITNFYVMKS